MELLSNIIFFLLNIGKLFAYPVMFLTQTLHLSNDVSILITVFLINFTCFTILIKIYKLELFSAFKSALVTTGIFFVYYIIANAAVKSEMYLNSYENFINNIGVFAFINVMILIIASVKMTLEHAYFEGLFGRFRESKQED